MAEVIICLGKKFNSEDERREYFRNELRKKLPELKKIDGFPVGEDEDIIALSDPPYYTACPNPWLNDFIDEWENEKKIKERLGLSNSEFDVWEPYAADISEGKNNPIYTAHTYHTKVPHPAIMRYLLYYTQPGDNVLDAFAGTGMTGVAAQSCEKPDLTTRHKIEQEWKTLFGRLPIWGKRNAICGDLSPYASFIGYNYNSPINAFQFEKESKTVFEKVSNECSWLYETVHSDGTKGLINYTVWSEVFLCSNCGNEIVFWEAALDWQHKTIRDEIKCEKCGKLNNKENTEKLHVTEYDTILRRTITRVKTVPVYIVYTCKGKRYQKQPEKYDIELINKINSIKLPTWVPSYPMMQKGSEWGDTWRKGVHYGITHIHHFYTKRNLYALGVLHKAIEESNLGNKMKFILTGLINRSTQMNRIHIKNFFYGGGGWNAGHLKGTLYVPSLPIETSILEQITDKIKSYRKAIVILSKSYSNILYVGSASKILLKENSIDYIFTDPPFGSNIMYSELNFLPESWLKVITNNKAEAIENKSQEKSLLDYQDLMTECFKEYYRVLKNGKWMTVEFSNTSAAVWNGIQTALQRAGFIIANVSAIDKKQGGMRSITTAVAVRQDLAISCYKPSLELERKLETPVKELSVWDFVKEHLSHLPVHIKRENSTASIIERSPKILFDRMITFHIMNGIPIPIDAKEFQEGLNHRFIERDGMFFTQEQSSEYDNKKMEVPNLIQLTWNVATENEGIEWLKRELSGNSKKYQDIQPKWMQAITAVRKGDILPELRDILQQNFIEDSDGSWRVPNLNEAKDRDILRNRTLLKEFNSYVELANNPKSKRLKEVRVEALRAGFKQCWETKGFQTIVRISDRIPQNLLLEDEQLLMYYDIAKDRV